MDITLGWAITFAILAVILFFQISAKDYHPVLFWAAIIATTTVGTEISDFLDRSLGLGYAMGSIVLVAGLAAMLAYWYNREGSLRVYPITKRSTEITFWIAVLFSNSLGTAFGDFLVDNLGLTFIQGALVTAAVIGVVAALHFFTSLESRAFVLDRFHFHEAVWRNIRRSTDQAHCRRWPQPAARIRVSITLALLGLVLYVSTHKTSAKSLE